MISLSPANSLPAKQRPRYSLPFLVEVWLEVWLEGSLQWMSLSFARCIALSWTTIPSAFNSLRIRPLSL